MGLIITGAEHKDRGQASLEMSVALACALLLTLATFKTFFWMTDRLVRRHVYYKGSSRGWAGWQAATAADPVWNDPTAINANDPNDPDRLRIFQ